MKTIKEKILYIKFAKSLGMPVDANILEEVTNYTEMQRNLVESVRKNATSDLFNVKSITEEPISEPELIQEEPIQIPAQNLIDLTVHEIGKQVVREQDSFQQPNPPPVQPDIDAIVKKLKFLEQFIGKIAMAGPGSGEVNLRYLDDVDRASIADGLFLRYNSTSKKFEFDEIDHLTTFDTSTQPIANVLLSQVVTLGNVDISNNITLGSNSRIIFSKANSYNIMPSLQLVNRSNEQQDFTFWLRKNYVDVADSASVFTIPARKTASIFGKLIATTPIPIHVNVNDAVQIMCQSNSLEVSIETVVLSETPPIVPHAPSVILLVSRI